MSAENRFVVLSTQATIHPAPPQSGPAVGGGQRVIELHSYPGHAIIDFRKAIADVFNPKYNFGSSDGIFYILQEMNGST